MNGRRGFGLASTDLPLLLFLLSAGLAVWPAYDRSLCWPSLIAIAAGVALYFAVSRLPASSMLPRAVAAAAVVSAAALGAYFISQYSHLGYAGKIGVVDRVATGITRAVPPIGQWAPHRNSLATGVEGMLFVAIGLAWTQRRRAWRAAWSLAALILASGLALSASRGAWLAVGTTLAVWAAMRTRGLRSRPAASVGLAAAPLVIGLVWLVAIAWWPDTTGSGAVAPAFDRPDRVAIYRQSAMLVRDYALTGLGLGGQFAMTLSRYVLLIQVPFLTYSHNLYLEVWLEQGLLGAVSGMWLLAAFVYSFRVLPRLGDPTLAQATGLGLLATLLHGIVDARQYVDLWCWGPFFVLLGLYASLVRREEEARGIGRSMAVPAFVTCAFLAAVVLQAQPLAATWHANLGAVQQAKAELGPQDAAAPRAQVLGAAEARFRHAVAIDPRNVTANLRLGLILMESGRFTDAVGYAASAWEADRNNPTARKALGLACVWIGDLERALPLLRPVPGIVEELNNWGWWRTGQHQPALALRAYRMSLMLDPDQPGVRDAASAIDAGIPPR